MTDRLYFITIAIRPIQFEGRGSSWDYVTAYSRLFPPTWIERTRRVVELSGVDRRIVFFTRLEEGELDAKELATLNEIFEEDPDKAIVGASEIVGQ